jgi:two-component sensor histidine kinase
VVREQEGRTPSISVFRTAMKRPISTRSYFLAFVAGVVLPLLAFATLVLFWTATTERQRLEQEVVMVARQAALLVDGRLEEHFAVLQGLAASSSLATGNLAQFHAEARSVANLSNSIIVLRDFETTQLLNTQVDFGQQLPPAPAIGSDDLPRDQGPTVSPVYRSPISGEVRAAVSLKVHVAGKDYLLAKTISTTQIRDALISMVPPEWIIAAADRNGVMVARSEKHEEVAGRPGRAEYLAKTIGESGSFNALTIDGQDVLAGYYRSTLSGWLFGANILRKNLEKPFWRSVGALLALGLLASVLSAAAAMKFGRHFTSETAALVTRAAQLGAGQEIQPVKSRLTEFSVIGNALSSAATSIIERNNEQDVLIKELNHRVKNTLATVQSIASQTMKNATSLDEARTSFSERLFALAKAHDILTKEKWTGASLQDLIIALAQPFDVKRFDLSGSDIRLPANLSLSVSLALTELMTNATKHGALSHPQGRVDISWSLEEQGEARLLRLVWREVGGPTIREPSRRGLGLKILTRAIESQSDGRVTFEFETSGLVCRFQLLLA